MSEPVRLAGRCGGCHREVERLWVTPRFGLFCAECIEASFQEPDEPGTAPA